MSGSLTPFAISGVLSAITASSFGLLVFLKSKNRKLGRIWFIFSLFATLWGLGAIAVGTAIRPEIGLLSWRLSFAASINWIPLFFYHYVTVFCSLSRKRQLTTHYAIAIVSFFIIPTPYFFESARLAFDSLYFFHYGPAFPIYTAWWFGLVIQSHWELIRAYKLSSDIKRNQIKYFFLATALGFGGGSLDFLPKFGIDIYPWGNFTIFVYPLIMAYAMLKYNLMDITIFFRRAALLIGVYIVLLLSSIPILLGLHKTISNGPPVTIGNLWLGILLIGFLFSMGPFLYAYFVRRSSYFSEHTLAGLTHELKSPLAAISSAFEMMQSSNAAEPAYQTIIQKNIKRLDRFVDDLLLSLNSKTTEIEKMPADLSLIIHKVIDVYQPAAREKNIHLVNHNGRAMSAPCDAGRIEQVVSNLVSNAIKFSSGGSIHINAHQQKGFIHVSVKDEGRGILPDDLNRVFDRFTQGKNAKGAKGTGLGLTIAKAWVEAHGGKIWAESDGEGKGTTVTFTLPGGI